MAIPNKCKAGLKPQSTHDFRDEFGRRSSGTLLFALGPAEARKVDGGHCELIVQADFFHVLVE